MNQVSSITSIDQLNDEEKASIFGFLRILVDHLSSIGIHTSTSEGDGSSGKLSKLNIRHLIELASDMCDEIDRRSLGANTPLPCKPDSSAKRNNARAKMAEFPYEKMNNLILEVVQELDNRKITPISDFTSEAKKRCRSNIQEEPLAVETKSINYANVASSNSISSVSSKKKKSSGQIESLTHLKTPLSFAASNSFSGMDSLNAMINDLGSMIDHDDNEEFGLLKQRYEEEIQQLKQSLGKFENVLIPEKNREIINLMSKVEEMNLVNARLRNELSTMNTRLCNQDIALKNQKAAFDTLKECIDNLLIELSHRAVDSCPTRSTVRIELISNNVFSDLNASQDQIKSALAGLNETVSNYNPKQCLNLLRIIANTVKAAVLRFDQILQWSQNLDLEPLCIEGDVLKSSYISTLSSMLVSGKDFTIHHAASDFSASISSFKSVNETFFNLTQRFENALQSDS